MNVIVWARVSSREQKEGYSLDAQLRVNRERAQANGWHVVREFVGANPSTRLHFVAQGIVLDAMPDANDAAVT